MKDEEGNGKQIQIDYMKEELSKIDSRLERIEESQNRQEKTMSCFIAGRATTCPQENNIKEKVGKNELKIIWTTIGGMLMFLSAVFGILGSARGWW